MHKKHEPIAHLVKRVDVKKSSAWIIRIVAFVLSIFACAIVSTIITDKNMGFFIKNFFDGIFGTPRKIWNLFHETSIILLVALAVTPCFKMKFWNIGGEGQILMGALGSAVIIQFMGGIYADGLTIFLSLVLAIAFGIVWAVIPAIFKAYWNTNETLLTLMMNYIAACLVGYFIKSVATKGTGVLDFSAGLVGKVGGNEFILKIIVAFVITVIMGVYLKYSKHGYELTVVGESENTAKYIGINTKKVIIRTLILCGVLCGITGFLLVSATNNSLHSQSTVSGRGFIGVLISWLGHFNPGAMALMSFLYVFINRGAVQVGDYARLGASYPGIMTGIFFFFIIATEFFLNYQIKFKDEEKIKKFFAPVIKVKDKLKEKIDKIKEQIIGKIKKKPRLATATADGEVVTAEVLTEAEQTLPVEESPSEEEPPEEQPSTEPDASAGQSEAAIEAEDTAKEEA